MITRAELEEICASQDGPMRVTVLQMVMIRKAGSAERAEADDLLNDVFGAFGDLANALCANPHADVPGTITRVMKGIVSQIRVAIDMSAMDAVAVEGQIWDWKFVPRDYTTPRIMTIITSPTLVEKWRTILDSPSHEGQNYDETLRPVLIRELVGNLGDEIPTSQE